MGKKRYYKVDETVYIKSEKTFGKILELHIVPERDIYKALVEVERETASSSKIVSTRLLDLWEIDKDKRELFKQIKTKNQPLLIPIKYFDEEVEEIHEIEVGDWIDLRSRATFHYDELTDVLIPLNVAMQLPEGYEAHLLPRSSTFKKYGIIQTNSMGVIDNSYAGDDDEWLMPAFALKKGTIKKNERVAQFRIVKKMPYTNFRKQESLGNANRGGFGSTGRT